MKLYTLGSVDGSSEHTDYSDDSFELYDEFAEEELDMTLTPGATYIHIYVYI